MRQDQHSSMSDQDTERIIALTRATLAAAGAEYLTCPECGQPCRLSERICARCGANFDDLLPQEDDKTYSISAEFVRPSTDDRVWPKVGAIPQVSVTVILDVENHALTLPDDKITVIGRGNPPDDTSEAYVDLGQFDARERGISRQHIKILRKETLIYVVDLDSTNGTWLNGRRLLKNVERLLRNGDELQLGSLKLRVKYR